jgi:lipopolysaccharide export system protein LptA
MRHNETSRETSWKTSRATFRRGGLGLGLLSLLLLSGAAVAQTTQGQLSGLKLSGDQPIQIESDKLEVKEQENLAIFTGNVNVKQGNSLLKSGRMTVYYAKEGGSAATGSANIDRLVVDNKVYLQSEGQVATGDRGTFDMKTEVMELTGKEVVLSEGANVLVGCKLTVQMKTGHAVVTGCSGGRVSMQITPSSAQAKQP